MPQSKVPDSLAYFMFSTAALHALLDALGPEQRDEWRAALAQYCGGVIEHSVAESVSERALLEMRKTLAGLLESSP